MAQDTLVHTGYWYWLAIYQYPVELNVAMNVEIFCRMNKTQRYKIENSRDLVKLRLFNEVSRQSLLRYAASLSSKSVKTVLEWLNH